MYKNILNNATPIVPKIYPNAKLFVKFKSFNKSGVTIAIPKYIQIHMTLAANGAAGIQNKQAGIILDTFCALFAPSQPNNPTGLPSPNGTS